MPTFNKSSSSHQDVFAYQVCGENKTYLEVGAADAIVGNNTYSLETNFNWNGISLELNQNKHFESWKKRKNKIYWTNALEFDYVSALNDNNITSIDYLQVDIEPAEKTFKALEKIISSDIKFKCCTFEHDLYRLKEGDTNYKILADNLLLQAGYKIAIDNVISGKNKKYYETWYVSNDIDWKYQNFSDWKEDVTKWAEFIRYEKN